MRRIGFLLVLHGQHALWQLAYQEWNREAGYCIGDETLFLLDRPTSIQPGYQGPPGPGVHLNTAVEAARRTRTKA